jgi:hypothetical protein
VVVELLRLVLLEQLQQVEMVALEHHHQLLELQQLTQAVVVEVKFQAQEQVVLEVVETLLQVVLRVILVQPTLAVVVVL